MVLFSLAIDGKRQFAALKSAADRKMPLVFWARLTCAPKRNSNAIVFWKPDAIFIRLSFRFEWEFIGKGIPQIPGRIREFAEYALTVYAQASAHLRQASAQALQWSWWAACFSHSAAQARQTSRHSLARCSPCAEPRASKAAVVKQMSAQSRSRAMHPAIIFTLSSFRQAAEHFSQATAQARQASIHCWIFFMGAGVESETPGGKKTAPLHTLSKVCPPRVIRITQFIVFCA